jgi:predicted nucleic acid-binding Zn ribbon protein
MISDTPETDAVSEILSPSTKPKPRSVTPSRHFSGKMSGSRNGTRTRDGDWDCWRSVDASCCYWCRDRFAPGQMRYPILHEWNCQPVSLCLDCFKHPDAKSYDPAAMQASDEAERERFRAELKASCPGTHFEPPKRRIPIAPRKETTCPGCGEPIFVAPNLRSHQLQFCSMRCYQRANRKRRREGGGSAIDWKWNGEGSRFPHCEACKTQLPKDKRRDGRFCSNRCRQWAYRARRR